jgi:hypothetical protein
VVIGVETADTDAPVVVVADGFGVFGRPFP